MKTRCTYGTFYVAIKGYIGVQFVCSVFSLHTITSYYSP